MDISACVVVRNVAVSSCKWWRPPGPSAGDKPAKTEVEIGQKLDCSFIFFRLRIPFTFLPTTLHKDGLKMEPLWRAKPNNFQTAVLKITANRKRTRREGKF